MYRERSFRKVKTRSKYNNKTTIFKGKKYHSRFEAKYAQDLELRKIAGDVKSWDRQVKISLDVNGKHICNYYLDFVVYLPNGDKEYVEVKGFETDVWRLKWKLFEAIMSEREPNAILTVVRK